MAEESLRELQGLLEPLGGRHRVLLAEEVPEGEPRSPAQLAAFARELFGEAPGGGAAAAAEEAPRVRLCLGSGGAGRAVVSPLVFLLCRAGSLRARRARARLREIARDLRSRLPRAPPPALVAVLVRPGPEAAEAEEEAARLAALLRRGFHGRRAGLRETLQAAAYCPDCLDGTLRVRRAACRALRAALLLRAGGEEKEKQRLSTVLRCIPWGRRSLRRGRAANDTNNAQEGGLQDPDEGVALTSMSPNGNCEEAAGGPGT